MADKNEQHKKRQQKVKSEVDARIAEAQTEQGVLQVITMWYLSYSDGAPQ